MPSNCWAFDSTFERQGDFIHLPVEIWAGCLPQKWPRSASRKTKIPTIPQARRRHGYKLLVHNTSQSKYYKGAAWPVWQSSIHTYSSLVQLKPAWQRYIASPKANHLTDWAIWAPKFYRTWLLFPSLSTQLIPSDFQDIRVASWQNQQTGMCLQRRLGSAWVSAQSDQSSLSAWRKLGSLATH